MLDGYPTIELIDVVYNRIIESDTELTQLRAEVARLTAEVEAAAAWLDVVKTKEDGEVLTDAEVESYETWMRLRATRDAREGCEEKTFEEIAKPIIEWLAKNKHPHTTIIIDAIHAEMLEGVEVIETDEFLRD